MAHRQFLLRLPYELLGYVYDNLNWLDLLNLSRTCKALSYILKDWSLCRHLLLTKFPHSREARQALKANHPKWDRAVRCLLKRQASISDATPYLVAIVGHADQFLYHDGGLCYRLGRDIRFLHLRGVCERETVINLGDLAPALIPFIPMLCDIQSAQVNVQLLYYTKGILSFQLQARLDPASTPANYLVVLDVEHGTIATVRRLTSDRRIFARNNENFLFYGTQSMGHDDGHMRWGLWRYTFATKVWSQRPVVLQHLTGDEIGRDVSFDLIGDRLYCLSPTRYFENREPWRHNDYYCCFFEPDEPFIDENIYELPEQELWRRKANEGPLDERWSVLNLEQDECTGWLKIVESRKEWTGGIEDPVRTAYTLPLALPERITRKDSDTEFELNYSSQSSEQSAPNSRVGKNLTEEFPRDTRVRPQETAPVNETRTPFIVHRGGSSSSEEHSFTIWKTPLRAYYSSCETFLDLVDFSPSHTLDQQEILLRSRSRIQREIATRDFTTHDITVQYHGSDGNDGSGGDSPSSSSAPGSPQAGGGLRPERKLIFQNRETVFWPPRSPPTSQGQGVGGGGPSDEVDARRLRQLHALMNPPTAMGHVFARADGTAVVYATGGAHSSGAGLQAVELGQESDDAQNAATSQSSAYQRQQHHERHADLVLLLFDPSVCLPGVEAWGGASKMPRATPRSRDGDAQMGEDATELWGGGGAGWKAKDPALGFGLVRAGAAAGAGSTREEAGPGGRASGSHMEITTSLPGWPGWIRFEAPMYRALRKGFDFTLPPNL